ncbi:hypothetical protein ACT4VZ_20335 (plasmid) [Acinetobacter baumannii]
MKICICNKISDVNTSVLDINEIEDYLILLEHSSWNDFSYTVTFNLYIMNMIGLATQRKIGQLKIAKENQTENSFSEIEEYQILSTSLVDQLPDSFYSLGENSEYYKQIKEYFNDSSLELLLLNKLKDIENNKSKFEDLLDQPVFDKAFKRTATYLDKLENDWFIYTSEAKSIFDTQITNARNLVQAGITDQSQNHSFNTMIFGYIVAAMENYLFTIFVQKVVNNQHFKVKFIASNIEKKFLLSDFVTSSNFVDEKVLEALHKISFHNVGESKDLFKNVLNHNLMTDEQSQYFINSVGIRHDCAHRGGYDVEGNLRQITTPMIEELITNVCTVVENVETSVL